MSKILVLGRTMDMGGTEVAMAALLQKLVEKKEDVTLLLVEKRGVLLERIPKEVEVRQMIWDKKPHPALERIVGKRETPAERSFYARGMVVFLMRVVYGKKRYGKLYERILECVEPETKQYDLVFDFFGFGAFTTAFGARKTNARKKAVWFHGENLWWLFRTRDFIPEYDKIYCVSEPVRKQVIARFPELADRTEVLLNFIDIKQVQRRSEEPLSDPQYTGELKFLTVGRASEEKGYDIAVQITAELKKRGLRFKWFIIGDGRSEQAADHGKGISGGAGNYFSRNARKSCAVRKILRPVSPAVPSRRLSDYDCRGEKPAEGHHRFRYSVHARADP